ncbi:hypothetical protein [Halochromatium sp.]
MSTTRWELRQDDTVLGILTSYSWDFPWLDCDFEPTQAGREHRALFSDELQALLDERRGDEDWRRRAATELLQPTDDADADADESFEQQRQATINTAVTATRTKAPVQPLGWAYLADLRLPPSGDCREAMAALRQSYRVAPIEPDLIVYRLELAVRCPRQWSPALLNAMRADLQRLLRTTDQQLRAQSSLHLLAKRPTPSPSPRQTPTARPTGRQRRTTIPP